MRSRRWIPFFLGLGALVAGVLVAVFIETTVGGVLIGAGFAVAVDEYRRARDEAEAATRHERQALDERRRVLYMALGSLSTGDTRRAEMAGTVANALAHHAEPGKRLSPEQTEIWLGMIASGGAAPGFLMEIKVAIANITEKLSDGETLK